MSRSMTTLTKDEAVKLHQELWDWLSKNPDRKKPDWPGWIEFDAPEAEKHAYCFACAYSADCENCLLVWPGDNCCDVEDDDGEGLFNLWDWESDDKKRSVLAAQIRDLRAREGE